jgi:hypothetical protein
MGIISTLQRSPKTSVEQVRSSLDNKTYYVYNVSKGFSNYSQLKSPYSYTYKDFKTNAYSLCNVHMIAMGLIYTGTYTKYANEIDSKYPELPRLPDKLAKYIIESPEMRDYYKKRFPSLYNDFADGKKDAYGPNEIHNVLSYGTNKFLDVGTVTYFSTNTSWKEILAELLYKQNPVGISGKFSGLNHIVLLVGCAYSNLENGSMPGENQVPSYLIVDDPFGKTYEYDKGLSGNDVWIPFSKCVDDFKSLDNPNFKYTHRFIRPEELGY